MFLSGAEFRNLTIKFFIIHNVHNIIQDKLLFTCSDKKSSMDNPTYDENISTIATPSRIVSNDEDETLFQNPLYSDVGHRSANNSYHPYEDTLVSISCNYYAPGALSYNY